MEKCSRCKCLRSDFTNGSKRCDRCSAGSQALRDRWVQIQNDPELYAKYLQQKRDSTKRKAERKRLAKEEKEKRFKLVEAYSSNEADPVQSSLRSNETLSDRLKALELYNSGKSTTEVALILGRTSGVVWVWLKQSGATLRPRAEATSQAMVKWHANKLTTLFGYPEELEVCELYAQQGKSLAHLAKRFRREIKTIKKMLLKNNIKIRDSEEQWKRQFGEFNYKKAK